MRVVKTDSGVERRIFVVGVPRSGTTLVQSLLAAHGTMTSFTESHFFSRHFALLPGLSRPVLTKNPVPRMREFLLENDEAPTEAVDWLEAHVRGKARLPFQTRRVARELLRALDEVTLRRGKSGWIEKTPRHLRYIPFLEEVSGAVSRTSFVHVLRDGLEVVASLKQASQSWERPYGLSDCVRRWNRDVRFSLERVGAPADHFVFYEELTSRPEPTLKHLLDALGLGWEPSILARYAEASDGLVTEEEAWKADTGRTISPSGTSSQALTPEQRHQANKTLHRSLYTELREQKGANVFF
jgi:hypothetical protein